jgi:hypothetical protein
MKLGKNNKGYVKVVGGLVALLIMIIIGVLVFWEVNDAIDLSSDDANDSRNTTTDMATTVFGLLPLIALVVVAAIILGIILAFGSGKAGM